MKRDAKDLMYWHEAVTELTNIINRITIEIQKEPCMLFSVQKDGEDIKLFNNNVAAYNRGAMKLREALLKELVPAEEPGAEGSTDG
jgi:hypothetical protein